MRIRSRLFVTYLILGAGLVAIAGGYLYPQVAREARMGIESRLDSAVRMVVVDLEGGEAGAAANIDERVDALARAADARVTVVAADGRVVADSEFDGEALAALENHAGRPEIEAARAHGEGRSERYSRSVEADLLYHARRIDVGSLSGGVARAAVPLTRVAGARAEAGRRLALALAIALTAAIGMGAFMARRFSRPVRELREAAARVVGGDLTARAHIHTGDEVEELADAFDAATARLAERIAAATAERDRLEGVLNAMVEGVVVTAADGRVALANAALRQLFGVTGRLEGRTPLEALRHPGAADALSEAARRREATSREIHVGWPQDRILALQAVGLPAGGAVGVFHDVTERRRLDAIRRDFVANVSHELRTPLATLTGYAEELGGPVLEPDQARRSVGVIRRQVARMTSLVDDLLALARLEAEGFVPRREPMDAFALIEEVALEWSPRAEERSMTLRVEGTGPVSVEADPALVRHALDNLVDNAVRHCPPGTTVLVTAARRAGGVELTVSDDGPGIPAEDQPRVFERFYRVEKGRSRETGGTGLGLAIVKHIVEAHGGRATLESRSGAGSTFRLFLPDPKDGRGG